MSLATCKQCGEDKPVDGFYATRSRGRTYRYKTCKVCQCAKRRAERGHQDEVYEWQSWQVDVSAPDMNNWLSLGDGNYITVSARD